jgi:hypothetical protein
MLAAGLLVGGCALSDARLGAMVSDTAEYEVLTCEQLGKKEAELKTRLAELDGLMQKAATGTGGGVVNAIAYRPEHITAQGSLDSVHRVEAEKGCHTEAPAASASPPPRPGRRR